VKKLVGKKLQSFRRYLISIKDIKCPFQWWKKQKSIFLIVGFLDYQIYNIVGFQIEKERIFLF
jgi:hypothetical protein